MKSKRIKGRDKSILLRGAGEWQTFLLKELDHVIKEKVRTFDCDRIDENENIIRLKKYIVHGMCSFTSSLRTLLNLLPKYKLQEWGEDSDFLILDSCDSILSCLHTSTNAAIAILNLLHTLHSVNLNEKICQ